MITNPESNVSKEKYYSNTSEKELDDLPKDPTNGKIDWSQMEADARKALKANKDSINKSTPSDN